MLAHVPGAVLRIDEPVIDCASFLADLAQRHAGRLLRYEPAATEFETQGSGFVRRIR